MNTYGASPQFEGLSPWSTDRNFVKIEREQVTGQEDEEKPFIIVTAAQFCHLLRDAEEDARSAEPAMQSTYRSKIFTIAGLYPLGRNAFDDVMRRTFGQETKTGPAVEFFSENRGFEPAPH